jgi:hypothetical protein
VKNIYNLALNYYLRGYMALPLGSISPEDKIKITELPPPSLDLKSDALVQKTAKETFKSAAAPKEPPSACSDRFWCVLNAIAHPFCWLSKKIKALFQRLFGCVPKPFEETSDLKETENKLKNEILHLKFVNESDIDILLKTSGQLDALEADVFSRKLELTNFQNTQNNDLEKAQDKNRLPTCEKALNQKMDDLQKCQEKIGKFDFDNDSDIDDDDDEKEVQKDALKKLTDTEKKLSEDIERLKGELVSLKNLPKKEEIHKKLEKVPDWKKELEAHEATVSGLRDEMDKLLKGKKDEIFKLFSKIQAKTLETLAESKKVQGDPKNSLKISYCEYWQKVTFMRQHQLMDDTSPAHLEVRKIGIGLLTEAFEKLTLPNGGKNICWMNATIQSLLTFQDLIEKGQPLSQEKGETYGDYFARKKVYQALINFCCQAWRGEDEKQVALRELEKVWADPTVFKDLAAEPGSQQDCRVPLNIALSAFGHKISLEHSTSWVDAGLTGSKKLAPDTCQTLEVDIPRISSAKALNVQELVNAFVEELIEDPCNPYRISDGKKVEKYTKHILIKNTSDILVIGFKLDQFSSVSPERRRSLLNFLMANESLRKILSEPPLEKSDTVSDEIFQFLKQQNEALSKIMGGHKISDDTFKELAANLCKSANVGQKKDSAAVKFLKEQEERIRKILQYKPEESMYEASVQRYVQGFKSKKEKESELKTFVKQHLKSVKDIKPNETGSEMRLNQIIHQYMSKVSKSIGILYTETDYKELRFDEFLKNQRMELLRMLQPGSTGNVEVELEKLLEEQTEKIVNLLIHMHASKPYFKENNKKNVKNTLPLVFPDKYTLTVPGEPSALYEIIGSISHLSEDSDSGHYIACKKRVDSDGKVIWSEYNDNEPVKELSEADLEDRLSKSFRIFLRKVPGAV